MIGYILSNITDDINNTIKLLIQDICKENKINYEKQEYKILFSNEKVFAKNNDIKFISGSKKSLSFHGKIYSNKNGKIIENIYLKDEVVQLEPDQNSLLVIYEETKNSTVVENDEDLLHFYIAPAVLLKMQDPNLWQTL